MTCFTFLREIWLSSKPGAARLIQVAVAELPYPVVDLGDGLRVVVGPPRNTYRTKVYVWEFGGAIRCQAATDIVIDRNLLGRELLLQLLEANGPGKPGVFWLVPHQDDRFVSLEAEVAASETTVEQLQTLILQLLTRFEEMVARLYAMDLVISGPEPFTPSPSSP